MKSLVSALEDNLAEIVRRVVREELQAFKGREPEQLLTAEGVARILGVKKQKIYSLAREGELEPVMISKREMRFAPETIKQFQLRKGIRAA